MSFIGDLFGSEKKTTTQVIQPKPTQLTPIYNFTGNASYTGTQQTADGANGRFGIAWGREPFTGLSNFNNRNLDAMNRTTGLIGRLNANQNPFIQARVNPYRQAMNERRGLLSRDLSRRGVQGSLANNELMKFDREAQAGLSDQTALATNDALSSLMQAEGLAGQLNEGQLNVANEYLKRDLAALGLNMDAVRLALAGREFFTPGQTQVENRESSPSILGGIGQLISLGKAF